MNNIIIKNSGASVNLNIGSEVNQISIKMYLKIIVLAFCSTLVNGRPQYQPYQPGFQQTQTFEPYAYNGNVPRQQEPINPYITNVPQYLPPNIHSRRADLGPVDRHQRLHERLERLQHHHQHFPIKPKHSHLHHHHDHHRFDQMPQQDEMRQNIETEMFTGIQSNYDNDANYAIADSNINAQQDPYMAVNNPQIPNEEATTNTNVPFNQAISSNVQDVATEKQDNIKSSGPGNDQYIKTVTPNENTPSLGSTNSERKPVSDAKSPIPIPRNKDEQGGKVADKSTTDKDRWVWGAADMTEKVPTTTERAAVTDVTPDLDDRASFDGDACPAGKVKFGNVCVDKE